MQQSEHDRTEQATPFKLEESRDRGEVQRSGELNTFALLAALLVTLLGWGGFAWQGVSGLGAELFSAAGAAAPLPSLAEFARSLMHTIIPFGLAAMALVILSNLVQTGPVFSFTPLKARFERINPFGGFRRIFSKRLFFELFKSFLKLGLLGGIAYGLIRQQWPDLLVLDQQSSAGQAQFFADRGTQLLLRLLAGLLVIGLLDWIFTGWQYRRQMMMTRRDLKEEVKRREGDPQIRARLRELQRENLKQSRSLSKIPDADVLITNPDHVAVALRYVRRDMNAPIVVAKGSDLWVAKMKEIARRHAVVIRESPPLARMLFRHGQIGRPIPSDTYLDVARLYSDVAVQRRQQVARNEVRA